MKLIFENWHRYLSEITRYEKETGKKSFGKHDITKYVRDSGLGRAMAPVKYAFTMVDIEKVGLNPRTKFNTPAGVYFYPLNPEYYEKLVKNKLPYASEKPYVGVVRLKDTNTDKWLKFISGGRDFQTTENVLEAAKRVGIYDQRVTPSDLPSGIDAYWELPGDEQMGLRHWDFNNDAKIFDLTWYGTKGFRRSTLKWNKLLRDLGYIGIYDNNNSIIHPGEPFQMVALSPEAYEVVGFYTTADIRKVDFPTSTRKLQQMAWKRGLPKWVYQKLAASNDWATLKTLITNPDMSKEVFEFIYNNNPSRPIILELAKSIFTPVEILRKIARESFPGNFHGGGISMMGLAILEHVAENPNAPEDVLMSLAGRNDEQIRSAVASNDNTGVKILKKIIEAGGLDEPDLVRAIIYNPNINSEIFHQLVSHQDITSRGLSLLANSASIPPELLTKMAMKYRRAPMASSKQILAEIARNPRTPEPTLRMLSKSETYLAVQRAIASNPSTPVDILEKMLKPAVISMGLIRRVTTNPGTPLKLLNDMILSPDVYDSNQRQLAWQYIRNRFRSGAVKIQQATKPPFTDKDFQKAVAEIGGSIEDLVSPDAPRNIVFETIQEKKTHKHPIRIIIGNKKL